MKQYTGNKIYRGCSYDFRLCSQSMKKVAEIFDISYHEARTYINVGKKLLKEDVYEGILVKPYGSHTAERLELTTYGNHDEMTFEEFKERIDKSIDNKDK